MIWRVFAHPVKHSGPPKKDEIRRPMYAAHRLACGGLPECGAKVLIGTAHQPLGDQPLGEGFVLTCAKCLMLGVARA